MSRPVSADRIVEALRGCYDPEIPVNIVDLGLVYNVSLDEGRARVRMTLTAPGCPAYDYLLAQVKSEVERLPGVVSAEVEIVWDPPWTPERMSEEARRRLESRRGEVVLLDFDPAVFRPVKKGHLVRNQNGTVVLINEANSRFLVNEDIARLWDKSHGGKTVHELAGLAAGELQVPAGEVREHVVEIFRSLITMGLLETGKREK
jgi:FeS assembly SUF system protein